MLTGNQFTCNMYVQIRYIKGRIPLIQFHDFYFFYYYGFYIFLFTYCYSNFLSFQKKSAAVDVLVSKIFFISINTWNKNPSSD